MTTLNRLLESVFEGKRFESIHNSIPTEKVEKAIKEIPFTLSSAQKSSIYQAFTNDVTYIQGPPGTGKSYTISALAILASKLGLKTLVASQKKPAVEIVYSKVSNLLGEEGCLFLTDNNDRKDKRKSGNHVSFCETELYFLVVDRKGPGDNLIVENLDKENISLKY